MQFYFVVTASSACTDFMLIIVYGMPLVTCKNLMFWSRPWRF